MTKITKKDLEVKLQKKNIIEDELKSIILNYADYEDDYVDTIYQFIIDTGIFYVACNNETEGLDYIIDHLEDEGLEGWFIDVNIDAEDFIIDTENNKYYYDEYIIGGNHGRYLHHGGNLRIEELENI